MTETTPDELATLLFDSEARPLVVDIRHPGDYAEWHIPGSENIDVLDEVNADPETAKAALAELPADRDIVTVCAAGVASRRATELLDQLGYDAMTLQDGMTGWSRVHRAAPVPLDIDGELLQVARPGKGCLSYILRSGGEAAVFDPSTYPTEYERRLETLDAELTGVFDTHAHADHVSGGRSLADRMGVPYYLHPADALAVDAAPIEDGQTVTVGSVTIEVVHTPGHTPGGVTYAIEDEALLTGDTLFHESVGRVELGVEAGLEGTAVEENAATLYESLQRLRQVGDDPVVLPAHDPGSPNPPVAARLSEVERRNPGLGLDRETFIDKLAADVPEQPPNFQRIKRVNAGVEAVDADALADLELGPNRCAAE